MNNILPQKNTITRTFTRTLVSIPLLLPLFPGVAGMLGCDITCILRSGCDTAWMVATGDTCGGQVFLAKYRETTFDLSFPTLTGMILVVDAASEETIQSFHTKNVNSLTFEQTQIPQIHIESLGSALLLGDTLNAPDTPQITIAFADACFFIDGFSVSADANFVAYAECYLGLIHDWTTRNFSITYNNHKIFLELLADPRFVSDLTLTDLQQFPPASLGFIRLHNADAALLAEYEAWLQEEGFLGVIENCAVDDAGVIESGPPGGCSEVTTFTPDGPVEGLVLPEASAEGQNE